MNIDGIVYDDKFSRSIMSLSYKYGYDQGQVATACQFFNDLLISDWHVVTDNFLRSCKSWKTSPIELLNNAVYQFATYQPLNQRN